MILVTEFMDEAAVAQMREKHETRYDPGLADRQPEIAGMMKGVRALVVRNRTQVNTALLDVSPDLECVGRLGVGLDNIDVEACRKRNIAVYPANGANNLSVGEYVITAAMVLLRQAWFANPAMLAGQWPRQACAGRELAGKTLGLVGFGAIARDMAKLASGLGMTIVAHDPFVKAGDPSLGTVTLVGFETLLSTCDVVSLHVPLSEGTRHLIDGKALRRMKRDAILINAARGGVVDEAALVDALKEGHLGGAALDVFENEPLSADEGQKFANVPNLILTPHVAGVTVESNVRVSAVTAQTVLAHLAGKA
ncbi:MAG: hydroxyacid dehydrogenase [Rhizobiaceae bacterium]